jgi:spore photoproduct lyase
VLPSNLDDFFERFGMFMKQFSRPIRIGTGEFCDSLAVDHITGYSSRLIDFFRHQPVLFELKTKSDNIANIMSSQPSPNIILSWSLNPSAVIAQEEFGAAPLGARLWAAESVQQKGYPVAFHFDPVVFFPGWETAYAAVVEKLYRQVRPPFRWISLGTLRGTRRLKILAEQRFPKSRLWYGELLLGKDGKLRYPHFLRNTIYAFMIDRIRKYDTATPLYLCMEDTDCWQTLRPAGATSSHVETSLLGDLSAS